MAVNVGKLEASFGIDDAEFDAGLDEADKSFSGFAGWLAKTMGAVGLGAIIADSFAQGLNIEAGNDLLAAQLGLTEETAQVAGDIASNLYSNAWGDSMEDVNRAIMTVEQNIGGLGEVSDEEFAEMGAHALDLAKIMDDDVGKVTRAAGNLMKNGLARDSEEAFDIITAGFQGGLDISEEWLDSIIEYSEPLAALGITGEESIALFSGALDAGAWNLDKVGDAFKEFAIRTVEDSSAVNEAYEAIGLDAEAMGVTMISGGDAAKQGTSDIIQALLEMTDPIAQEAAGVALFGTMWEDLGPQVIATLDPMGAAIEEVDGKTDAMSDTLNDNSAVALEAMKRQVQAALIDTVMKAVEVIQDMVTWLKENKAVAISLAAGLGAVLLPVIVSIGLAAATTAISFLIMAAPFIAIAAGVALLTFAIIKLIENWDAVAAFMSEMFNTITELPGKVLTWLGDLATFLLQKGIDLMTGFFSGVTGFFLDVIYFWYVGLPLLIFETIGNVASYLWGKGRDLMQGLWDGIKWVWNTLKDWVIGVPGMITEALGDLGSLLYGAGKAILNGLWDGLKDAWGGVKDWVGGLGGAIAGLKGPIEADRVLLLDEGAAIMEGLGVGLEAGADKHVFPMITGMASRMSAAMGSVALAASASLTGTTALATVGGGTSPMSLGGLPGASGGNLGTGNTMNYTTIINGVHDAGQANRERARQNSLAQMRMGR